MKLKCAHCEIEVKKRAGGKASPLLAYHRKIKGKFDTVRHVLNTITAVIHGKDLCNDGQSESGAAMCIILRVFPVIKLLPNLWNILRGYLLSLIENGKLQFPFPAVTVGK